MSLKAKLEAVIYAAEEPVTLAQLAALFTADALEWKAEHEAASAEQTRDGGESEPQPAGEWEFDSMELSQTPADSETSEPVAIEQATEPIEQLSLAPDTETDTESEFTPSDEAVADVEREARRLARLREREVSLVLRQVLDELIASYASDSRGVEIREIAGGYRMATKPECHDAVRSFVKSLKPALRLSLPALETLAIVAYKQPVTAPEVSEIRGIESANVLGTLLARKLIATAGRKQVIGRPILYRTTREFLLRFGMKDVSELPSMEEFEKLAAIELDEPEFAAPGELIRAGSPDLSLELDESLSEEPVEETSVNVKLEN